MPRHPTPLTEFTVEDRGYKTPCHIWGGYVNDRGYAQVMIAGKVWLVHRLIWRNRHGPIPPRTHVHHKCEQKACMRLGHLKAMTPRAHTQHHRPATPLTPAELVIRERAAERRYEREMQKLRSTSA